MNKLVLALAFLLCLAGSALAAPNAAQLFESFKSANNKQYEDPMEEIRRFEIFQENILLAEKWNEEAGDEVFGVTGPFADLTQEEFQSMYLMDNDFMASLGNDTPTPVPPMIYDAPEDFEMPPSLGWWDWSTAKPGSVTPVKNQGQCGSCAAFAATEVLESKWVITGHPQRVLSPQQLVDCTYPNYNGCKGIWYYDAWNYLARTTGQATAAAYPYKAAYSGGCKFVASTAAAKTTGTDTITSTDAAMYNYLHAHGPIAVTVDASKWGLYKGGVFPPSSCTGTYDHAVVITGHTNINGVDVWRVRNSWGSTWGSSGYIYIRMHVNSCSINQYPRSARM